VADGAMQSNESLEVRKDSFYREVDKDECTAEGSEDHTCHD
jgi:hypothetical protein